MASVSDDNFTALCFSVTPTTQGYKVSEFIGLFVVFVFTLDIAKLPKRCLVVNFEASSRPLLIAILASVIISLKSRLALNEPIRPPVVYTSPTPTWVIWSSFGLSSTFFRAVFSCPSLDLIAPNSKGLTAILASSIKGPCLVTALLRAIFSTPIIEGACGYLEDFLAITAYTLNAISMRQVITLLGAILVPPPLKFIFVNYKNYPTNLASCLYFVIQLKAINRAVTSPSTLKGAFWDFKFLGAGKAFALHSLLLGLVKARPRAIFSAPSIKFTQRYFKLNATTCTSAFNHCNHKKPPVGTVDILLRNTNANRRNRDYTTIFYQLSIIGIPKPLYYIIKQAF